MIRILLLPALVISLFACTNGNVVSGDTNKEKETLVSAPAADFTSAETEQKSWADDLKEQIALIDEEIPGNLGVYIKNLEDDISLKYNTDNDLYFASTTKIPVAVAILQRVEEGELSLDDKVVLQATDYVDGNGDVLWQKPGTIYSISTLLEKMVQDSDNCATDMLIRLIGEEELNRQVKDNMIPEGFNSITSLLNVRYKAFNEVHDNASRLSNIDILKINSSSCRNERFNKLVDLLEVNEAELKVHSIEEAFSNYYQRGYNSGKLHAMGLLLEKLYNGELLSEEHTSYLLEVMDKITTGDRRIKAGLPPGVSFAQKTGTQVLTASNAGIIFPENFPEKKPLVVVVNVSNFNSLQDAENAMRKIGQLLTTSFLVSSPLVPA